VISHDEINPAADRLKDALGAAADVMTVRDSPVPVREPKVRRAAGWLLPLAAAASVVVIVLATVFAGQVFSKPNGPAGAAHGTGGGRPEFYMTTRWALNKLVLDVRRTAGGSVTASASFRDTMAGHPTADASDRAFFAALFPCTTATTVSRLVRIAITDSGKISGIATVGSPIRGMVTDLALSPDGKQMAYTQNTPRSCIYTRGAVMPRPQDAVHIMDLATGTVRTWQNTPTAARDDVGGLSWMPDGRTLIVNDPWSVNGLSGAHELSVFGLDTASNGGSLPAHSRLLWHQDASCTTCALQALAGPGDSLTAVEVKQAGTQQTRQLIVRIPLAARRPPTVLYSTLSPTPISDSQAFIFADPSGKWVITWGLYDGFKPGWQADRAGWISGGQRHLLPGANPAYPDAITW
jgi:hypothetical protein